MSTRAQIRFCILGSGSDGNCAFMRTPSARVLIDAGFSSGFVVKHACSHGCAPWVAHQWRKKGLSNFITPS